MDIRAIAQRGGRITKGQLAEATGLSERTIRTAIELGVISPPSGRTKSAYYTITHILEADAVRVARSNGRSMTSLAKGDNVDHLRMPRGRGSPIGRSFLVTQNLMLIEVGPQTPNDREVRRQVIRLGWQYCKSK